MLNHQILKIFPGQKSPKNGAKGFPGGHPAVNQGVVEADGNVPGTTTGQNRSENLLF